MKYNKKQRKVLLDHARAAIAYGLKHDAVMSVDAENYEKAMQQAVACFVTLRIKDELRGCIGSMETNLPLIKGVCEKSYEAAFCDPRFQPLNYREYDQLDISISILSPITPIKFESEEDLIQQIHPGIDGLVLEEGTYRSTFLPTVWSQFSNVEDFLEHLKIKAGLPADYWSDQIQFSRYSTETFESLA